MKRILVDTKPCYFHGVPAFSTQSGEMLVCGYFVQDILQLDVWLEEHVVFEFRRRWFSGATLVYLPRRPAKHLPFRWSLSPETEWLEAGLMWSPLHELLVQLGAKWVVYVKGTVCNSQP